MPNYASVTVMGHIGRDIETRSTPAGDAITSFSLATSRKWKDKSGDQQEDTTWWNCSMFGKRGEVIARYLKKGDPILVHGEPSMRMYTKQDGGQGVSLDVRVSDFAFVGGKSDSQPSQDHRVAPRQSGNAPAHGSARQAPATQNSASRGFQAHGGNNFDDDIPFAAHERGWFA